MLRDKDDTWRIDGCYLNRLGVRCPSGSSPSRACHAMAVLAARACTGGK
jgi:hypothetical protein